MRVFALIVCSFVWVSPVLADTYDTRHIEERAVAREDAVMYVCQETGVPADILRSMIGGVPGQTGESSGYTGAVRWCSEWVTRSDGKLTCPNDKLADGSNRQKSCYYSCRGAKIWKNRLDIGIWGLRDPPAKVGGVPVKGWSWIRWYERKTGEDLPEMCALDWTCASVVMVAVIRHLQAGAAKAKVKCRKPMYVPELQWLEGWNGCSSYRARVSYWISQGGKPEDFLKEERE